MKTHKILTLSIVIITLCANGPAIARPYKDSPIKTIIVPYYSSAGSDGQAYRYPQMVLAESRHVKVPESMEIMPRFNLQPGALTMGSTRGLALHFADGAYPVFYMPGNANGRFNGKISLLI